MELELNAFNELIRKRRSIYPKMYTGEKVDDQIVQQMLENANWAPSNKMTAPWRFCIFTGEGLKRLGDFQSELYKEESIRSGNFLESKYEELKKKPLLASHVISIGMKRDPEERVPEIEEIEATACAVQNMYLTAAAYGIGCYWGSGGITYKERAKPFFGLGEKDKLLGFLFVGIPRNWPPGRRGPMDEKIRWIR